MRKYETLHDMEREEKAEKRRAAKRAYYHADPEKQREYQRRFNANWPEKAKALKSKASKTYYLKNRERILKAAKEKKEALHQLGKEEANET